MKAESQEPRIFQFLRPESVKPVAPYSALAEIYDDVMRHVNYGRWASYVRKIAKGAGFRGGRVLDVACGTGNFLAEFTGRGRVVAGCDYSLPMVAIARRKLRQKSGFLGCWSGDMRRLAVRGGWDMLVCLYDSINYLPDANEYRKFFIEAAEALRSGGILVFDVCTIQNSVINFDGYRERSFSGDKEYLRFSYFDRYTGLQVNEFLIGQRGELEREALLEVHRQWIRPLDEVTDAVERSPLEIVQIYDGFTNRPGSEASWRVHYLCRKP
ncbi:MAG TPA: class I SAM-dependent methyltransferase [Bacteroidetes bacterium]|nr:class I SAM-dependent methyltransferase [Bacteroidota bacterium]